MPRGNALKPEHTLLKGLILGDPKVGKTEWALKAAEAGFNLLYADGDVAGQTINEVAPEHRHRIFYLDIADRLDGGLDPRMIDWMTAFFNATTFLWNDTKQREYSKTSDSHDPETGACLDEIWVIKPSRLDHNWIFVLDSWSAAAYSAMVAKAKSEGIDLADIEKAERNLYQGTGNRLTNFAVILKSFQCHVIVIGHGAQYEKRKSPEGMSVKEAAKENNQIVEWTKMVPKSSSNPHGLTMGKHFSDIGWIDVDKWGKRKLDFDITNQRVSGGHLTGKGDPRGDFSCANLIKKIGGVLPDPTKETPLGLGLTIHPPGTFIPAAAKPALALGAKKAPVPATPALQASESPKPTAVKGLGGLMLKKPSVIATEKKD